MTGRTGNIAVALLLLSSCTGRAPEPDDPARSLVERAVEAHGGMDAWRQLEDVTWRETITRFDNGETAEVTVRKIFYKKKPSGNTMMRIEQEGGAIEHVDEDYRVHQGTPEGVAVIGNDGEEAWYEVDGVPQRSEEARRSARYVTQAFKYWFGLPFKLLDAGTRLRLLEPREVDGRRFNLLEVTFEEGVGDTPRDRFVYWFDDETGRIGEIRFWRVGRVDRPRRGVWSHYVQVGGVWKETLREFYNAATMEKASERRFEYLEVNSGLSDDLFQATHTAASASK